MVNVGRRRAAVRGLARSLRLLREASARGRSARESHSRTTEGTGAAEGEGVDESSGSFETVDAEEELQNGPSEGED